MGQEQSRNSQLPFLVNTARWGVRDPRPEHIGGELVPSHVEREEINAGTKWRSVHRYTKMIINDRIYPNTRGHESVEVTESILYGQPRVLTIEPVAVEVKSKRAREETNGLNQASVKRAREEGASFIFNDVSSLSVEFSDVYYVGGSFCIANVPEHGLNLLDFDQGTTAKIHYDPTSKFVGFDTNGSILFKNGHFAYAEKLEIPTQSLFVDPNASAKDNLNNILKDNTSKKNFEHAMQLKKRPGSDVYEENEDRDNFVKIASNTTGCSNISRFFDVTEKGEWLNEEVNIADFLIEQLQMNKGADQILRSIHPTQAGHCVSNDIIDELNSKNTTEWDKALKRVGIISQNGPGVDFRKILNGNKPENEKNQSEKEFQKFIESHLCIDHECKKKFLPKVNVGLSQEQIELLANIVAGLSRYSIVDFIKYLLQKASSSSKEFTSLWEKMTLPQRKCLIENMQDVLKNGRCGSRNDYVFNHSLVRGKIWGNMEKPRWGYGELRNDGSGRYLPIEELKPIIHAISIGCDDFREFGFANAIIDSDYETKLDGVTYINGVTPVTTQITYGKAGHFCLSALSSQLVNVLLNNPAVDASSMVERMKIPYLDSSADDILKEIGGPPPATESQPENSRDLPRRAPIQIEAGRTSETPSEPQNEIPRRTETPSDNLRTVNSVDFSPIDDTILFSSGTKIFFSDSLLNTQRVVENAHEYSIKALQFSPDGTQIASGSMFGGFKIHDTEGAEIFARRWNDTGNIQSLDYSPDGRHIAIGTRNRGVIIWDTESRRLIQKLTHTHGVYSVAYSPDGNHIISTSGKQIRRWNANTGKLINVIESDKHISRGVAYSPDGQKIAYGVQNNIYHILNANDGSLIRSQRVGNSQYDWVENLSFSPDSTLLVAGYSSKIEVLDLITGNVITKNLEGSGKVLSISHSPDGRRVLVGRDGRVVLMDRFLNILQEKTHR